MEYAISRAMEITRLSSEQLAELQDYENNTKLGAHPFEIQAMFNMPELKVAYGIPELEPQQASYGQRLRNEFFKQKLFPKYLDVGVLNVEKLHEFDNALIGLSIDYVYSGGGDRRKKIREGLDDSFPKSISIRADLA